MASPWYRRVLTFILALALAAALVQGLQRYKLEAANRTVELIVPYEDLVILARQQGLSLAEVASRCREAGATAVLFREQTLPELMASGRVVVRTGLQLRLDPDFSGIKNELMNEYTYLLTASPRLAETLEQQLKAKGPEAQKLSWGSWHLAGTPLPVESLNGTSTEGNNLPLGLGFPLTEMKILGEAGLHLVPQIRTWPEADGADFGPVFQPLLDLKPYISLLIFNDSSLPGFPGEVEELADTLREFSAPVAVVEFFPQQGLSQLVQILDKRAVRLHSIPNEEILAMSPGRAEERLVLAATDRDVRALLVRLFNRPDSPDWLEENLGAEGFIPRLKASLEAQGFTLGQARPLETLPFSRLAVFIIGLGAIAGGMLLLDTLGLRRLSIVLGLLGLLAWGGLLFLGYASLGRKLMALGAVVVFPTLAIITKMPDQGLGWLKAVLRLGSMTVVSLAGAVLMVGLLADTNYMLKLDQFAGVKVAHLLPLLLVFFIAAAWPHRDNWREELKRFLASPVSWGYSLVAGILVVAVGIYLIRTGNDSGAVSSIELQIRGLLDRVLVVRPRTKEFLIGHPLMFFLLAEGYRRQWLPVLLLASIGQISLVNTFAHIHTPLAVSLLRTVNGLWLGILLGMVLVMVYRIGASLWAGEKGDAAEDG